VAVAPAATAGFVQLTGGPVQVQPGAAAAETETKVTSGAGVTVSVRLAVVAVSVPTFVTICVYVMLPPAATPFGEAALVTVSSAPADAPTIVEAEAVLLPEFGSLTEELAEAVSVITVPFAVPVFTFVISEKVAAVPPAILRSVQTTLPVLPTGGVVQVQPAGAAMETNVVLVGTASTRVVLSAALGPLLVRTWV
jgi:hypothetical protein